MADTATFTVPDAERLVCDHLRAAVPGATVATGLVGWRKGQPWLMVSRTGGASRYGGWLDAPEVAVEARAASREAAADLAAAARAALAAIPRGTHPGAVVTAATEIAGPRWLPEDDLGGTVRQQWRLTIHPDTTQEATP